MPGRELIDADLTKLSNEDLLKRASTYVFSTGMGDGASILAEVNTCYDLTKIHYTQQKLGFKPSACFISTPD
jgi:hypothetical protein